MSPVGGVGINLAIQDAVAAANILAVKLAENKLENSDLAAVQCRREFPTRATQALQSAIQTRVIRRALATSKRLKLPWFLKLVQRIPALRRIPARVIGMGIRPEHVRTPEASRSAH
jgi:2-polyprenyl-6-methoxyphenol hydroxylase-like FAD-dependent oxidoreductase